MSTNPNDLLGAFVGEECRGVVHPVQVGETQLFFLTMYSNLNSESLTLKTYIVDLDTTITINENIDFIPGAQYGNPTNPIELNAIVFYDHFPSLTGIPDQVIEIGSTFVQFDLDNYLIELDGDAISMSFTGSQNLNVDIAADNLVSISVLDAQWVGSDTIYFMATDQTGAALVGTDTVHFTVLAMDHPPELTVIPGETIGAGGSFTTIDLEDYLLEADGDSVQWSLQFLLPAETDPEPLWNVDPVNFNSDMSFTAQVTSRGASLETDDYLLAAFVGTECRGLATPVLALDRMLFFLTVYSNTSGEALEFRLYDGPNQLELPILEDQIFESGAVVGTPEEPVQLQAGQLLAYIEASHLDVIAVDSEWYGSESIQIMVQEHGTINSYRDSTSTTFNILQDHTPLVHDIANQTIELGESFSIFDLDDYLTELDGDGITWSISGNSSLNINVDAENLITITPVDGAWTGTEVLTFTAMDDNANQFNSSDTASFTIIPLDHAPSVGAIPDQIVGSGGMFSQIHLDDYLSELDGHNVQWSYHFDAPIETDSTPSWSVNPANYESDMTITAAITSRGLAVDHTDFTLAVFAGDECRGVTTPIQALDSWLYFLTIYANESGEELTLRLYDGLQQLNLPILETYEFEASSSLGEPGSPIQLTAGFIQVSVEPVNIAAIMSMDANWSGSEAVWFTAQDLGTENGYSDSTRVTFTILEDHTPLISAIPDQIIEQGESFSPLDLDDYLIETDGDEVIWSVTGQVNLSADIDNENLLSVIALDSDWIGSETLVFLVNDVSVNALYSTDTVTFIINPLDHAPEITLIPNDTIGQGGEFQNLDLNDYLLELDGDQVEWSYEYGTALEPVNSPDWAVNPADYEFNMSLTARVILRSEISTNPQNILAVFSGETCRGTAQPMLVGDDALYFLTIHGSVNGEPLTLRIYDSQRQDTIAIHESYSFESNAILGSPDQPEILIAQNVGLELVNDMILQATQANTNWSGTEVIRIQVQDLNTTYEYLDSSLVYFTVLPDASPSFISIPDQVIEEGGVFPSIALDDYLEYPEPEGVRWVVSGESELIASIGMDHELNIEIPNEDWYGSETLMLELQRIDNPALNARQEIHFSVIAVNDAPQVESQYYELAEDSFVNVTLTATDVELDALTISVTQDALHGQFEDDMYAPDTNYFGLDSIGYVAFDGDLYSDTALVTFLILPVNDAPEFTSSPQLQILQNEYYSYEMTAADIDGDSTIFIADSIPEWLSFDGVNLLSGLPTAGDVGTHYVRISVTDGVVAENSVSQIFSVVVGNVNDPPQFTSSALDTASQDMRFEYTLNALDLDGDSLSYAVGILPAWLEYSSPQQLTGIPGNQDVGEYNIQLFVADIHGARDTLDLHLFVLNVNDPPYFISSTSDTTWQGSYFEYELLAEDVDGDSLTYSTELLPEWLNFSAPNLLSGSPTNQDVGEYTIGLVAVDPQSAADSIDLNIVVHNVNDAPLAFAGDDRVFLSGMQVRLSGEESYDIDNDTLHYQWLVPELQVIGSQDSVDLLLKLPEVAESLSLLIQLRVFDGVLYSGWDSLFIDVEPLEDLITTEFVDSPVIIGESLTIELEFPAYFSPLSAMLFYLSGGSSALDSVIMASHTRSLNWSATIAAGSITETGLSYFVEAVDVDGNKVTMDRRSIPVRITSGSYDMTNTQSSAYPDGIPKEKWRLTSVPTILDTTETENIFNNSLAASSGENTWRLYDWDGTDWQTPDTIGVGRGYWFQHRLGENINLRLGAGRSADLTNSDIILQPGWNIIGSPYNFAIPNNIDSIQFSGPYSYGDYSGEGWMSHSDSLRPWEGYALFNWADSERTLSLNPNLESTELGKVVRAVDGWRINISAHNQILSDMDNQIGRSGSSYLHRDALDKIEPPVWRDGFQVSIVNPDLYPGVNKYARDIRSLDNTVEVWSVQLTSGQRVSGVSLMLDLEGELPLGHVNILLNIQDRSWTEVGDAYRLNNLDIHADIKYKYEILSGPEGQVAAKISERLASLPEKNYLAENFPNPFNGSTQINFSLRDPGKVQLDVFDIRGRHLKSLVNESLDRGHHTVNWNGLNQDQLALSSGLYLYRITIVPQMGAKVYQKTRKMVLIQ